MKYFFYFLIISEALFGGFVPPSAYAQIETLGFHFRSPRQKQKRIEFQQSNNLIILPVKINGYNETFNFVLDTGVGYTLITDPKLLNLLNLKCVRQIKVSGTGNGRELKGCISSANSFLIDRDIIANNQNLIVLEEDVLHLSSYAGIKIHGLIGYDLFSRFVIKINYLSRTLDIIKPENYQHKAHKKEEVFPLSIEYMKPYIQAEAVLASAGNPSPAVLKLILDTGAGHSLSLDTGAHPDIKIPEKNIPSHLGMTLNGAVEGSIARIEKFKLGNFELEKVITAFPDTATLRYVRGFSDRQGNIGCGVLKRFHLVFDYPHKRLILRPNRAFSDPFEFNTSGMEVVAEGDDFKTFVIGTIRKNSPADEVGLQKGDTLIAVDDNMSTTLTMSELYKIVNKKGGRRTALFVKRNDLFFIVEILLREPI
ncbi:MAG: aspartyl protease family protein [Microscillaceae bacterium]|jgi:hypothetical protein|nr:aspartyl protease family protein [Microscillaceae bacterium]